MTPQPPGGSTSPACRPSVAGPPVHTGGGGGAVGGAELGAELMPVECNVPEEDAVLPALSSKKVDTFSKIIEVQPVYVGLQVVDEPEAEGPPSAALALPPSFGPWLRSVGEARWGEEADLGAYEASLVGKYDHPAQVVAIYASLGGTLDPQFFEDAGIANVAHRRFFAAWFATLREDVAAKIAPWTPRSSARFADIRGGFSHWLEAVDPNGGLTKYAAALASLYDSPAQVVAVYATPSGGLDAEFFKDAGVQDSAHEALFRSWFAAWRADVARPALRGPATAVPAQEDLQGGFMEWLQAVDPAGSLAMHAAGLRSRYDCPAQLVDLYASGDGGLDQQFFGDACIIDAAHASAFKTWFAGWCAVPQQRVHRPTAPRISATLRDIQGSFTQWLRAVAPEGTLDGYAAALSTCYDCPAQAVAVYAGPGGTLDPLFFKDAGMTDAEHAALFRPWFASWREAVARSSAPVPQVANQFAPAASTADLLGGFERWLRAVDPAGRLGAYSVALSAGFDCPAQTVLVYQPEGGAHSLDTLLFEDVGVAAKEHRALFEAWFAAWRERGT